ncbi:MAG: hypothetical protein O2960_03740 [Verrucomicrobia bacterium]|nr:hypothetical protein [Verrucomicrobiota bacterium]
MTKKVRPRRLSAINLVVGFSLLAISSGCKNHLAFGTATKFGLDISQKADQTIDVTMGYRRAEMASIPVPGDADADGTQDVYSVLGRFTVSYGDPFKQGTNDGLHLRQFFATGMAARIAATNSDMRHAFGEAASKVKAKEEGGK